MTLIPAETARSTGIASFNIACPASHPLPAGAFRATRTRIRGQYIAFARGRQARPERHSTAEMKESQCEGASAWGSQAEALPRPGIEGSEMLASHRRPTRAKM